MEMFSKVLVTGGNGFTGHYLKEKLIDDGYNVVTLTSDITNIRELDDEINNMQPDYVIHLAAISFPAEKNIDSIYKVNVIGTINLLESLVKLKKMPKKVILASSATVYGNASKEIVDEATCPQPQNHYGCSKLIMEHMSNNFTDKLPIILTRPFNYTGIGHDSNTLIPKIVSTFKANKEFIELGNIEISREFNDVRDISRIYSSLLSSSFSSGIFNLCSGNSIPLKNILKIMEQISGHKMEVKINKEFVRPFEVKSLSGCSKKLSKAIDLYFDYKIEDTLVWMYENETRDFS